MILVVVPKGERGDTMLVVVLNMVMDLCAE